ncbi:MAG TPA: AAA family ATPase, partial [Terriglobales bacterium]|nr:AAA family ATPase [Terriglobales bacterium]
MNAATAPTPFPVVRPADLSTAPASSAPWLIDQLWTAHAVGIIGGTPKSYKTWMALEMAVSVASGSACLTTFAVPSPGPVLLYAAEDSQATLRLRLESLAQHPALRWLAWTFASSPRILCAWTASPTNSGLSPLSCFTAPFFSSSTPWSACMPSTKTPPARLR